MKIRKHQLYKLEKKRKTVFKNNILYMLDYEKKNIIWFMYCFSLCLPITSDNYVRSLHTSLPCINLGLFNIIWAESLTENCCIKIMTNTINYQLKFRLKRAKCQPKFKIDFEECAAVYLIILLTESAETMS